MAKKPYNQGKKPCYHTHKALEFDSGGVLYGGNCSKPIVDDADIYIGLESMNARVDLRSFPWNDGEAFTYPIVNGGVPEAVKEFVRLVDWIADEICHGKKIHVGCIGGHGRTGLVLAVVCRLLKPGLHSTAYVREHYCKKAVETQKQVEFLDKIFGITPVVPYYVLKNQIPGDVKDDRLN